MDETEQMTKAFREVNKSERLVYTALDETDRSKEFWWKCNSCDPVSRGMADHETKPAIRAESEKSLSGMLGREPYIAVLICLPAAEATEPGGEVPQPEPIGVMTLRKSFDRCGAFYMVMLPEYQNKGYGRESLNWAIDYAFTWCDLHKVAIGCASYNTRACHLYADMGFVQDGQLRQCIYLNRKWHDLVEFSMLESEWVKLRGLTQ